MKKCIGLLLCSLYQVYVFACDACQKQQPAITRGVSHGGRPDSEWDYLIVGIVAVLVLLTLFFSIKWLIRPGERSEQHIKYVIINS
ncbi:MAG: hypothetical protein J7621_21160 [Niastella sp.]|nr:hypothetical protein [Niastella sp.]